MKSVAKRFVCGADALSEVSFLLDYYFSQCSIAAFALIFGENADAHVYCPIYAGDIFVCGLYEDAAKLSTQLYQRLPIPSRH